MICVDYESVLRPQPFLNCSVCGTGLAFERKLALWVALLCENSMLQSAALPFCMIN